MAYVSQSHPLTSDWQCHLFVKADEHPFAGEARPSGPHTFYARFLAAACYMAYTPGLVVEFWYNRLEHSSGLMLLDFQPIDAKPTTQMRLQTDSMVAMYTMLDPS